MNARTWERIIALMERWTEVGRKGAGYTSIYKSATRERGDQRKKDGESSFI